MPNTIADNLQRLITAKTDIKNAIITMGGGVDDSHGLTDFANDILGIPSGEVDVIEGTLTPYLTNYTVSGYACRIGNFIFIIIKCDGNMRNTNIGYVSGLGVAALKTKLYGFGGMGYTTNNSSNAYSYSFDGSCAASLSGTDRLLITTSANTYPYQNVYNSRPHGAVAYIVE